MLFAAVLGAQAAWSVGHTSVSGVLKARIADGAPESDPGRVYPRGQQAD